MDLFRAPSVGLVDQPQNACFYDWHLLDAKDSPFAAFRLHYRSWTNLKQLNLIPATELERLHEISPKALKCLTRPESDARSLKYGSDEEATLLEDSDEAVFKACSEELDDDDDLDASHYFLKSPPELFPTSSLTSRVPQPSKALRDGYRKSYLQRPLPELPVEAPPGLSRRSSIASARSVAVSITPSLQQYVDEGSSLGPDEVEFGVAQLIRLPPSTSTLSLISDENQKHVALADRSFSDYDNSPQSTNDSCSNKALSPSRYLPTTGSGLEHGLEHGLARFTSSPKQPVLPRSSGSRQSLPESFMYSEEDLELLQSITLTESEWMSRSPSLNEAASHETGKIGGKSLSPKLRKSLSGSPRKLAEIVLGRSVSK